MVVLCQQWSVTKYKEKYYRILKLSFSYKHIHITDELTWTKVDTESIPPHKLGRVGNCIMLFCYIGAWTYRI